MTIEITFVAPDAKALRAQIFDYLTIWPSTDAPIVPTSSSDIVREDLPLRASIEQPPVGAKLAPPPKQAPEPVEEPKAEEPVEEPKAEEPKAEEPKAEEPAAEEPAAEELAAEEPAAGEPIPYETIRNAVLQLSVKRGRDTVFALLTKYGAHKSAQEIDPEHYADVLATVADLMKD